MPDEDPLEQFYNQYPGLRPGGPAGGLFGGLFKPGAAPSAPSAQRGGGTNAPAAPVAPPPLPPGFVPSPTPGRGISQDGFTAVQLNPQTNQWQTVVGYAPSAAERQAAGVTRGTGGGTGTRDFTAEKSQTQQTQGATPTLPQGAIQVAPTRAIAPDRLTVLTRDPSTGS